MMASGGILALDCDICGEPAVGVACSSSGAVSFAYCSKCLSEGRDRGAPHRDGENGGRR